MIDIFLCTLRCVKLSDVPLLCHVSYNIFTGIKNYSSHFYSLIYIWKFWNFPTKFRYSVWDSEVLLICWRQLFIFFEGGESCYQFMGRDDLKYDWKSTNICKETTGSFKYAPAVGLLRTEALQVSSSSQKTKWNSLICEVFSLLQLNRCIAYMFVFVCVFCVYIWIGKDISYGLFLQNCTLIFNVFMYSYAVRKHGSSVCDIVVLRSSSINISVTQVFWVYLQMKTKCKLFSRLLYIFFRNKWA